MHRRLYVAEDRVYPLELRPFHATRFATDNDGLIILQALIGNGLKTGKTIGQDDAVLINVGLRPNGDFILTKASDLARTHRHRMALLVRDRGGNKQHFFGRSAARLGAATLAAPASIVDLNRATQRALAVPLRRGLHDVGLDIPRLAVRHAKMAHERKRGKPVSFLDQQIHNEKPDGLRQLWIGEQCAAGY